MNQGTPGRKPMPSEVTIAFYGILLIAGAIAVGWAAYGIILTIAEWTR